MRRMVLLSLLCLAMTGCSCKEWGYCAHIFPNAERFANAPEGQCQPNT